MTSAAPAFLHVPDGARGNYGAEVADFAEMTGRPLDPSQRVAVDALTSFGAAGRWLALEGCVKEPRQNGKTGGIITPIALTDLFLWPADRIAWTAHLFKTCREAFADHKLLIDSCDALRRRVKKITEANGEESIELLSGARMDYLARSKGGGRGLGGKRVVIDEALFYTPEQAGALLPILAARDDPQVTYGSSGCKTESGQLRALTRRGRSGKDPTLIWAEWCADGGWDAPGCLAGTDCSHQLDTPGCVLDDPRAWRAANPAMEFNRITIEFMQAMRRTLSPLEFGREFLGWDEPGEEEAARPISLEDWASRALAREKPSGVPAFAVVVAPGMASASISAAAADPGGLPHVELAEARAGTSWLVDRCKELAARNPDAEWFVYGLGAVRALIPDLTTLAIIDPKVLDTNQMAAACGHLERLVDDDAMTHSGDHRYATSLAAASKRDAGDAGWLWGWRKSEGDIAAIESATTALWGQHVAGSRSVYEDRGFITL